MKGSSLWQVLLALCISWLFCFVLTVTNTLPKSPMAYGYMARTDTKGSVLSQAPWFRFPYPGEEKWVSFLFGTRFLGLSMGFSVLDGGFKKSGEGLQEGHRLQGDRI